MTGPDAGGGDRPRGGISRGRASGAIMTRMATKIVVPGRPQPGEYAEYYGKYIALVTSSDIMGTLEGQRLGTSQLLGARSEREGNFRYAPDKWSVKEMIGHLADSERIFAYRALRIARGDQTPLSGFEQDDYVKYGGFSERALADLAEEFAEVCAARGIGRNRLAAPRLRQQQRNLGPRPGLHHRRTRTAPPPHSRRKIPAG